MRNKFLLFALLSVMTCSDTYACRGHGCIGALKRFIYNTTGFMFQENYDEIEREFLKEKDEQKKRKKEIIEAREREVKEYNEKFPKKTNFLSKIDTLVSESGHPSSDSDSLSSDSDSLSSDSDNPKNRYGNSKAMSESPYKTGYKNLRDEL